MWRSLFYLPFFVVFFWMSWESYGEEASSEKKYENIDDLLKRGGIKQSRSVKRKVSRSKRKAVAERNFEPVLSRMFTALYRAKSTRALCGVEGICQQQGACGTSGAIYSLCWLLCARSDPRFTRRPCARFYRKLWHFSFSDQKFDTDHDRLSPVSYLKNRLVDADRGNKVLQRGICRVVSQVNPSQVDDVIPLQEACRASFPEVLARPQGFSQMWISHS